MTEQVKEKTDSGNVFTVIFKVILGLAFLVLGIWATIALWPELLIVAKGLIGPFSILVGIIILAVAKE